jgi:hypothetical protein
MRRRWRRLTPGGKDQGWRRALHAKNKKMAGDCPGHFQSLSADDHFT